MKTYLISMLLGTSCFLAQAGLEVIQTTETTPSSDPLVVDVRRFQVVGKPGLETLRIEATHIKTLGAWSLEVLPGQSKVNVDNLANVVAQVVPLLPEGNRTISSILVPTFAVESLAGDFSETLRNFLEEMSGNVEPKSKAMFIFLRDFYRDSAQTKHLKQRIEEVSNIRIRAILPGNEINFESNLLGRPWRELRNQDDFGFKPKPSFVLVVDRNQDE